MTADTPLATLGLSPHALRALYDKGWKTAGDVVLDGLEGVKGIGPATLRTLEGVTAELAKQEKPRCELCRHWLYGDCHRYPPTVLRASVQPRPERPTLGVWPETDSDALCGEFKTRTD